MTDESQERGQEEEPEEEQLGQLTCDVCGEVSLVDPNKSEDMLDWFNRHVFGHATEGEEDAEEEDSRRQ